MDKNKSKSIHKIHISKLSSVDDLKKKIYTGEIILFSGLNEIIDIKNVIDLYFSYALNKSIDSLLNDFKANSSKLNHDFLKLQALVKKCNLIKHIFCRLFSKFKFKLDDLYIDSVCLRYSPRHKSKSLGSLKPVGAHRDTWASNIYQQINWWIPLHDVDKKNSIYVAPSYFKKKILNNSSTWNYKKHKLISNYPSVPSTINEIDKKYKIPISMKFGEVLCFSGNHLHGSNVGEKQRLNIETRTVNLDDTCKYILPKNIDSNNNIIQNKWFKNILNNNILPKISDL